MTQGYAPRQIGHGTGGPSDAENLCTLPPLCTDFPGWQVLHAADMNRSIHEGPGHSGKSALIGFVARHPALDDIRAPG